MLVSHTTEIYYAVEEKRANDEPGCAPLAPDGRLGSSFCATARTRNLEISRCHEGAMGHSRRDHPQRHSFLCKSSVQSADVPWGLGPRGFLGINGLHGDDMHASCTSEAVTCNAFSDASNMSPTVRRAEDNGPQGFPTYTYPWDKLQQ